MTTQEWLDKYDESYPKFRWFIKDYFTSDLLVFLHHTRVKRDLTVLMDLMNNIWFYLPDSKFNIMENPKGWSEFLFLLENPPTHRDVKILNPN